MTVRVKLFGSLKRFLPEGGHGREASVEVPPGGMVQDVVRVLGVDEGPLVVLVNGEHAETGVEVREGDVLSLFPPI